MTPFSAVLFDRDGTLVADVPYNGDPERVRLLPGAAEAVALARSLGLATGVVSNQSGVGRGLITADDVRRVNERADALLGGLDTWVFCPHTPETGCDCRKPRPGLILTAAARLGVPPAACLVIGDIAADVLAARAAGAHALLVPNPATAPAEVARFADQSAPTSSPRSARRSRGRRGRGRLGGARRPLAGHGRLRGLRRPLRGRGRLRAARRSRTGRGRLRPTRRPRTGPVLLLGAR
ncbi:D-glycero-alpha-D-manno-heptose-1,7-bisphosphate 7-phosphatase [Streptomyces incarnatus]|uniref:D-glycero-alpha-D-manno-heptose-1,7-bisphosphate 7-phosphatase n=1 Tax=Streptomyces incarnatus TaxID=665007 RepID=UPI000A7AF186